MFRDRVLKRTLTHVKSYLGMFNFSFSSAYVLPRYTVLHTLNNISAYATEDGRQKCKALVMRVFLAAWAFVDLDRNMPYKIAEYLLVSVLLLYVQHLHGPRRSCAGTFDEIIMRCFVCTLLFGITCYVIPVLTSENGEVP